MPTSGSWRRYHGYTSKHTNPPILTEIARVPRSSGTCESSRRLDRQDTSRIDIVSRIDVVRPKCPREIVSRRIHGKARMEIRMWSFACHNSARGGICEIPQRKSTNEVKLFPPPNRVHQYGPYRINNHVCSSGGICHRCPVSFHPQPQPT